MLGVGMTTVHARMLCVVGCRKRPRIRTVAAVVGTLFFGSGPKLSKYTRSLGPTRSDPGGLNEFRSLSLAKNWYRPRPGAHAGRIERSPAWESPASAYCTVRL